MNKWVEIKIKENLRAFPITVGETGGLANG